MCKKVCAMMTTINYYIVIATIATIIFIRK